MRLTKQAEGDATIVNALLMDKGDEGIWKVWKQIHKARR